MSTELNLDAERISDAEIAGIMGWRGPGAYTESTMRKIKLILEADRARRTAPVSAPIVEREQRKAEFLQHLAKSSEIVDGWPSWKKGMWKSENSAPIVEELPALPMTKAQYGLDNTLSFSAIDMRNYAREAIAPYAERIRQLERELAELRAAWEAEAKLGEAYKGIAWNGARELAERKTASIGEDGEFQDLVGDVYRAGSYNESIEKPLNVLIAYIDGRTAGAADAESEYELHQDDMMVAGTSGKRAYEEILHYAAQYVQDGPVEIYKVVRTKLSVPAAAPTPKNSGMEEA
jgi:hypothetical protein